MKKFYYIASIKSDLTSEYIIIYKNKVVRIYHGYNLSTNSLKQIIKEDYKLNNFSLREIKIDYSILKRKD